MAFYEDILMLRTTIGNQKGALLLGVTANDFMKQGFV